MIAVPKTFKPDSLLAEENLVEHKRKDLLPRKVSANSLGVMYYRSDYELRWLRLCKKARVFWSPFLNATSLGKALKGLPAEHKAIAEAILQTVSVAQIAGKEAREWCETERRVLRIAQPSSQPIKQGQRGPAPIVEIEANQAQ